MMHRLPNALNASIGLAGATWSALVPVLSHATAVLQLVGVALGVAIAYNSWVVSRMKLRRERADEAARVRAMIPPPGGRPPAHQPPAP